MSNTVMNRTIIKRLTKGLDLTESGIGTLDDICINTKGVKKHTKIIANHFDTPFYTYGPFQINPHCHIQEDYSLEQYNKLNTTL